MLFCAFYVSCASVSAWFPGGFLNLYFMVPVGSFSAFGGTLFRARRVALLIMWKVVGFKNVSRMGVRGIRSG